MEHMSMLSSIEDSKERDTEKKRLLRNEPTNHQRALFVTRNNPNSVSSQPAVLFGTKTPLRNNLFCRCLSLCYPLWQFVNRNVP